MESSGRHDRNELLFRAVNEKLRILNVEFEGFANELAVFVCECDDPNCRNTVLLPPHEYDARRPAPIVDGIMTPLRAALAQAHAALLAFFGVAPTVKPISVRSAQSTSRIPSVFFPAGSAAHGFSQARKPDTTDRDVALVSRLREVSADRRSLGGGSRTCPVT